MNQIDCQVTITAALRAEHHALLDAEHYSPAPLEMTATRYREHLRNTPDGNREYITFIADLLGEIAGFINSRLEQSADPMHRNMTYCNVTEVAVSKQHQNQGIGERLLLAAEDRARRHGAQLAFVEYHAENTRQLFYQRTGYSVTFLTANKRREDFSRALRHRTAACKDFIRLSCELDESHTHLMRKKTTASYASCPHRAACFHPSSHHLSSSYLF